MALLFTSFWRYEPTYEGLKHSASKYYQKQCYSYEPTYEGLKL